MNHDALDLKGLHIPHGEVTKFGDYTIKIEQDEDAENPRVDCDSLGTMVCWHSRYNLGDDHNYQNFYHLFHELSGLYEDESYENLTEEQVARCHDVANAKNIILPLYLYDHSGITMRTSSFSCNYDSGQVGLIYVSLENVRKEYSKQRVSKQLRERVEKCLTSEVEIYDQYLTGEVYGYTITKGDDEFIDSCWGYFGSDDNHIIHEIKGAIEFDITQSPQQTELELH